MTLENNTHRLSVLLQFNSECIVFNIYKSPGKLQPSMPYLPAVKIKHTNSKLIKSVCLHSKTSKE